MAQATQYDNLVSEALLAHLQSTPLAYAEALQPAGTLGAFLDIHIRGYTCLHICIFIVCTHACLRASRAPGALYVYARRASTVGDSVYQVTWRPFFLDSVARGLRLMRSPCRLDASGHSVRRLLCHAFRLSAVSSSEDATTKRETESSAFSTSFCSPTSHSPRQVAGEVGHEDPEENKVASTVEGTPEEPEDYEANSCSGG